MVTDTDNTSFYLETNGATDGTQTSAAKVVDAADGWTKISFTLKVSTSETYNVRIYTDQDNANVYIDDASFVELDQVSPATELLYNFEADHIKTSRLTGDVRIDDSLLIYPSSDPGANARILEAQDHDGNALFRVDREGDIHIGQSNTNVLSLRGIATLDGNLVIDTTNTEAFLVRKEGDTGDVFAVDTTNERVGFFDVSPQGQTAAYNVVNVTTDRTYDADATTVAELADVLGTLISDLQGFGLLG